MDKETRDLIDALPEGSDDQAKQLSFTNFAKQNTIRRSNGMIYGNWQPSFNGACAFGTIGGIAEQSVISMRTVGNCPSGESVVMADHY